MTDIAERLLEVPQQRTDANNRALCAEAADEIERLRAALQKSDGVLFAITSTLNSAGIEDYEGNLITEINVLQGVRRLIEHANG